MPQTTQATITVDGRPVPIRDARNLIEVVRAAGVDLPTFCYHSELSIHGACRLCVVDVQGKGVIASCSTPPEPGMVVRTQTDALRRMRRTSVELLLASHRTECPSCDRASACRLQDVARRVGVERVRFHPMVRQCAIDRSSPAVTRDNSKCVLCGDCVRMCEEVQGIGALDFAFRGAQTVVQPAFGKGLGEVDCVGCGQCARVCPTGALAPTNEIDPVWKTLNDPDAVVVAQVAPAVRVAIGERYGIKPGPELTGKMVAALKRLGFAQVYDTTFTADLTVWEEGAEFVRRLRQGGKLPLLTSCCPAWVKYVEQFHGDLLGNLSSCKSPQQMFGAVAKQHLPARLEVDRTKLKVVSIMPCTAKKAEARREEFARDGIPDVDNVITTDELIRMIDGAGMKLDLLEPEAFDRPFGARTGAGLLFGASGGVAEAVLRYANAVLGDGSRRDAVWEEVRGEGPLRVASVDIAGRTVRIAVVSGLANARHVLEDITAGRIAIDLLEVMACPGGCVNGAGQPQHDGRGAVACRTQAMQRADRMELAHNSADNDEVRKLYERHLHEPGSHAAEELLHTTYRHRRRMDDMDLLLTTGDPDGRLVATVCLGTSCHLRGSQDLLKELLAAVDAAGLGARVDVRATFCLERCAEGPNVHVDDTVIPRATVTQAMLAIEQALARRAAT